jgi:large subunit ribosomal protein L9
VLAEPIRALGHYEVEVKLLPELRGKVVVTIMRQGGFEDVTPVKATEEQAQESGQPEEETAQ